MQGIQNGKVAFAGHAIDSLRPMALKSVHQQLATGFLCHVRYPEPKKLMVIL
jgi:hypothetical protein